MIASAGYVQALLAREGLRPNKNLGQNFFIDGERLQRLLSPVELEGRPVLHKDVIDKTAMEDYVLAEILK